MKTNNYRKNDEKLSLDRIDFEILRLLQKNILLPNKMIAAQVGLAPSSVHERVKRLWEVGLLQSAQANINLKALGLHLEALLMLELSQHDRSTVETLMQEVVSIPEVRSAFLVTGRYDLIVHVVVKDMQHLKDLSLDKFTSRPHVTRISTSLIYEASYSNELLEALDREE